MKKSNQRLFAFTLSLTLLCAVLPAFASAENGESIVFKDPTIAAAMEVYYSYLKNEDGSYPVSELAQLSWFMVDGDPNNTGTDYPDIDLSELHFLSGVTDFYFSRVNKITGINVFSNAKPKNTIALFSVNEVDLAELAQALSGFYYIAIAECGKLDLSPLAVYADTLTGILLGGENIDDISFLAGAEKISAVNLDAISDSVDLSPLMNLNALASFSVRGSIAAQTEMRQIIENNPKINSLTLSAEGLNSAENAPAKETYITLPAESIAALANLNVLSLGGADIKDLAALTVGKKLLNIRLTDCLVDDLSVLANMKKLRSLGLTNMPLKDFSFEKGFAALTDLSIDTCPDVDFPTKGLKKLKNLTLMNCGISDVSFLTGRALESLSLRHNLITDISPLEKAKSIQNLYLFGNEIADYSPLAKIKKLKMVSCPEDANVPDMPKVNITFMDGFQPLQDY